MTNSTAVDRSSTTAEQQLLSIANKSLYHHHHRHKSGGERSRSIKKLPSHLPTLTREELTELIKHGLSATIDEELFMMKTAGEASKPGGSSSSSNRRRSSHHRPNHHHHNNNNNHYHSSGANPQKDQDGPNTKRESPTKAKKRKSAEEIFYATINGEELSVSDEGLEEAEADLLLHPASNHAGASSKNNTSTDEIEQEDYVYNYDEEEDEFPDSFSFANFDLIKDERMGELLKHDIPVDFFNKKTTDLRKRESLRNKPRTTTSSSLGRRAGGEENASSSSSSSSGGEETTTASTSIMPSDEDDLSITDIKQYVMEHLSDEVKSLIPEETWTKILSKFDKVDEIVDDVEPADDEMESIMTTKSTKDALKRLLKKSRSKKPSVDIDVVEKIEDSTSVVSDVTAHTVVVKTEEEQKNKKQVSFHTEIEVAKDPDKKFGYPSPLSSEHTPTRKSSEVSVKFSHIDVRYYERILELNPSVTNGPPIGIGWRYRRGTTYSVDEWEMERKVDGGKRPRTAASSVAGGPRSAASHLILPRAVREKMLYDLGYSQQEIAQALRTVRKLKDQRRTTVDNLSAQSVEEAVEKATTLMKNMLRVGRKRGVVR